VFHVVPANAMLDSTAHHGPEHMAGLVLGLAVPARDGDAPPRAAPRRVAFRVRDLGPGARSPRTIGVAIGDPGRDPLERTPGPPLILTRDQPTDVTVYNQLSEPTAIHWHGLELESYSDGVASWSGDAGRLAPPIAPGDSFVARLTQPRSGTFIYHTHLHDVSQLTAGLYGALLVLEPGERYDPTRDHVFVVGWDGPQLRPARFVLNGSAAPEPLTLTAGTTHRLRLVNIGPAGRLRFVLMQDAAVARWRPLVADGAALPLEHAVPVPASVILPVGSTLDVEFAPPAPGEYRLTLTTPGQGSPAVTQRIVVR
jgi:FtsP/CotA-like multicopper oxidase with cupredoxin domain